MTDMTQSEPDSAAPTGEPATAERSPRHDPRRSKSLGFLMETWSTGMRSRAERKRELEQILGLRRRGGWGQKGWKCERRKQGDPPGPERCSWSQGPKSRRAGVRASIVAGKQGNACGAKGCRKVEAQRL